jgi:phosphate acetyltransferase
MSVIENLKTIVKQNLKTIVMPESRDKRILEAAAITLKESLANIILIGDRDEILKTHDGLELARVIDPKTYDSSSELIDILYNLRKSKGMTYHDACELIINNPLYFATTLIKAGKADGMVAGAVNVTGDVLRPALQIIKAKPDTKLVSSFFIIEISNSSYGHNGCFIFADCGLVQEPSQEQLAHIALSSAKSFENIFKKEPIVALLSHSTKGSASSNKINKVINAVNIAKLDSPHLKLDGELQLDAAIDIGVANKKTNGSTVAGKANVLIFPDIDSGNIGYKLVQRLAGANAYGPIVQGLVKPVNDLSRGCTALDVVGAIVITAMQAIEE